MKKLLVVILLISAFVFKPSTSNAQLTYDQGYEDGFKFAVNACMSAAEAHPEWSYSVVFKVYYVQNQVWAIYTIRDDEGQAALLAVNYVNASYYSGITARKDINAYYNGYYFGYMAGTADFVLN